MECKHVIDVKIGETRVVSYCIKCGEIISIRNAPVEITSGVSPSVSNTLENYLTTTTGDGNVKLWHTINPTAKINRFPEFYTAAIEDTSNGEQ